MPTFRFKYQAVLRQRQAAEEQCQRELARHMHHQGVLQKQLSRMEHAVSDSKQQLQSSLVGHVDVDQIRGFARYAGQVHFEAQRAAQQLEEIDHRINKARADLAEAMRQRKAMELLRDRHYEQWLAEQKRQEMVELDELAVQRYARGMSAEGAP